MYRGTTPTYIFIPPEGLDLTEAQNVYITFSGENGCEIFTKTGEDLEVTAESVSVYLTQQETLQFPNGRIKIQINWTYQDGAKTKRAASEPMYITANPNLIEEVIE